ncbi:nuclear apoptosis-inducing factor 1-like isoform X1 [Mytilus edulis]|uniref:nuclear apoptosis-inducing factor 1-like isoform X1 n=2 Tax=Mytilus edulis TaxID=6550 RepID=UPI0039F143B1
MDSIAGTGKAIRWSKEEVSTLVTLVTGSIDIIKGKFSPGLSSSDKTKCWNSITESINSCNIQSRSVTQVKQKWLDLQSDARKKENKRRRDSLMTGGGPAPPEIDSNELKIISVTSDAAISGLESGYDSLAKPNNFIQFHEETEPSVLKNPETAEANLSAALPTREKNDTEKRIILSPVRKETKNYPVPSTSELLLEVEKENLKVKKEKLELEKNKFALKQENQEIYRRQKEEKLDLLKQDMAMKKRALELLQEYVKFKKMKFSNDLNDVMFSPIIKMINDN